MKLRCVFATFVFLLCSFDANTYVYILRFIDSTNFFSAVLHRCLNYGVLSHKKAQKLLIIVTDRKKRLRIGGGGRPTPTTPPPAKKKAKKVKKEKREDDEDDEDEADKITSASL
jgi:hypothetical protein